MYAYSEGFTPSHMLVYLVWRNAANHEEKCITVAQIQAQVFFHLKKANMAKLFKIGFSCGDFEVANAWGLSHSFKRSKNHILVI